MKTPEKLVVAAAVLLVMVVAAHGTIRYYEAVHGLSSQEIEEVQDLKERLGKLQVGDFIETQEGFLQIVRLEGATAFTVVAKDGKKGRFSHHEYYHAVENWRTVKRIVRRTDLLRPQPEWDEVAAEFYRGK